MSNFFDDFIEYSDGTEAPPVYFRWGALAVLSSLVGRRIYCDQGCIRHHCNLNILLVGPPGAIKSTVMQQAKRLTMKIDDSLLVVADSVTVQALTQIMGSDKAARQCLADGKVENFHQVGVFANELVNFLGKEPRDMVNFLTDIWDSPLYAVSTKNKGNDTIPGPYLTLLGCLTPDTLKDPVYRMKLVEGGFQRRVCFCWSSGARTPVAFPEKTETQMAAFNRCVARGKLIRKVSGAFKWTQESRSWFEIEHAAIFNRKRLETDNALINYLQSYDTFLIKFAMLLQLAESDELVLTVEKLTQAKVLLAESISNMQRVFANTGRNELSTFLNNILVKIREAGAAGITHRAIVREFMSHMNMNEIEECLRSLKQAGHVADLKIKLAKTELPGYVAVADPEPPTTTSADPASERPASA